MVKITRRQVTFVIGILFTVNTVLAKYDECGKRKDHFSRKIIGGNVSQPGLWPWHVGMKRKNAEGNWKNFCGGALIDSQWLLTAAHCFYVRFVSGGKWLPKKSINPLKKFKIIAGDHITDRNEPTEQERTPLEIHIHPDYRYHPNSENDIALIKLNRKVILGPNVRTVCLPGKDFAKPGHYCFATGWGMTESGRPSTVLRHSRHMIQKNEICNRTTKPGYYNETVMFCAGDGKGHSDTCQGDSGGSVVRRVLVKGQYRWVTIGIVSWGEGCAVPGKYGYYTRLQPFMEWILRTKDSLCANPGPLLNGVGKPNKRHYRRNDKVMYQCNVGYTRTGKSVLSCQGDNKWDGHKPLCLASCSDPGVPKHGVRLDHDFKHGQSVRFRCKQGFHLIGEPYITCDNGRWDNDSPNCSVPCPDVGHPINGLRKPNKQMYSGETVTFECKKDYTMLGESLLYCQGNGKWNGYKPICFAPCRSPLVPQNVIRLDNSFTHGKSTRFRCKNGYQMIGGSKMTCINGRWSRNPPTCLAPCSNPGIPINGNRLDRSFLHGHQVRFSCYDGFTMNGEHTITCNNGRWNNTTPNCLDCDQPLGMEDGRIPDANIRASTYTRRWYHSPKYARLNGLNAWCAPFKRSFLEVDLGKTYRVMYVATQGSAPDKKWVKHYIISHTLVRSSFIEYREKHKEKLFMGNNDATTIVKHKLNHPFIARKVRFIPFDPSRDQKRACMRVEIYGCDLPTDCVLVGSPVLGRWVSAYKNIAYYKAYVKKIDGNYAQLEIESEDHHDDTFKELPKRSIVLDAPPKQDTLRKGTTVLAPFNDKYYLGKILRRRLDKYIVRLPDKTNSDWIPINKLRLQEPTKFCD